MMNNFQFKLPVSLIAFLFIFGCTDNDPVIPDNPEQPEEPVAIEITDAFNFLTDKSQSAGSEEGKVWQVAGARLVNSNGAFDIDELPNVQDDEFIFVPDASGYGITMIWRPRNAVRLDATNADEARLDYYLSPVVYTGTLNEDDPSQLVFDDGEVVVEIISEDEINIEINSFPAGRQSEEPGMLLSATPKTEGDYAEVPAILEFTKLADIDGTGFMSGAPGLTASLANNALYWAHRIEGSERVWSYDLATGDIEECVTELSDFVSKQLHVINDELKVVGAQNVNSYGLDLTAGGTATCNPDSQSHGLTLSRYGSAVLNNSIYIFGGDLNETDSDKIFRYNDENNNLEEVAVMPSPKAWANGEIVDGKLYIFGGQAQFSGTPSEDDIYIYDFDAGSFDTQQLPEAVFRTFAARNGNLIYVAGQKTQDNPDIFFGVYDTVAGTFTEVPVNLADEGNKTIHQLTAMDNKLYVLYGGDDGSGNEAFSIQVADLL